MTTIDKRIDLIDLYELAKEAEIEDIYRKCNAETLIRINKEIGRAIRAGVVYCTLDFKITQQEKLLLQKLGFILSEGNTVNWCNTKNKKILKISSRYQDQFLVYEIFSNEIHVKNEKCIMFYNLHEVNIEKYRKMGLEVKIEEEDHVKKYLVYYKKDQVQEICNILNGH